MEFQMPEVCILLL